MEGLASVLWELLRQRGYKLRHVEDGFELFDRDPGRAVAAIEEHFRIWHEGSGKAEEGADPAGLDSATQHTASSLDTGRGS